MIILVNTKHLYNICTKLDQRQRRWSNIVQMLFKCFVFAGVPHSVFSVNHLRDTKDVHRSFIR